MKSEKLNRAKELSFRGVFAIRREEWPVAAIVTVLLLMIHYFFISFFLIRNSQKPLYFELKDKR